MVGVSSSSLLSPTKIPESPQIAGFFRFAPAKICAASDL
jgi:hypothetical protein